MFLTLAALAAWSAGSLLSPLIWIYATAIGLSSGRWTHVALWSLAAGAAYCLVVMIAVEPPSDGPSYRLLFGIVAVYTATIGGLIYLVRNQSAPRTARHISSRK
jgi:hypothetical protein